MYPTDWTTLHGYHEPVICPACGESDYEDCFPDPHLHRIKQAIELLTALYARYIAAFVRPRWRCLSCGVKYRA